MPETPEEKKFRIQQGVVKRLAKEHKSYIDETNKGVAEIAAMRATEGHDEYVLKKMVERNEESRAMIGDACRRLSVACADLATAMEALGKGEDDEGVKAAKELLESSRIQVECGAM
ncbi:tbca-1 [Pristionchus pacificus]|uniref:Tubulin-specific chaperone A n=1 Tax=Pristionchus pacificus TaxID=54126 RepID=A0A2A6BUV1_PRIPA|nr:tbca-1 [Pristionchus pacificus]|eukprot:PDM69762.1 hypothetical protein PRIPAC_44858 [Pristionchus pacificus]